MRRPSRRRSARPRERKPISDLQAIADRVEIEALRGEFTDAGIRYRRTPEGWKFTERADEIKYLDTTPLAGSPPQKTTTTGDTRRSA
jgi:hypothetical protein